MEGKDPFVLRKDTKTMTTSQRTVSPRLGLLFTAVLTKHYGR